MANTTNRHLRLTLEAADRLKVNAEKCGLSQNSYIESLIMGYMPKEKPDDLFYDYLKKIYACLEDRNDDTSEQVRDLIYEIEKKFLEPDKRK